jgi:Ca2+-binding RTX toxin-like protein
LLNNLLTGNDGNNVLDGLTGKDTMVGGGGNDIYYTNGLDLIVENPDHGYDVVISSASHSLFENIEELRLTGTANLNGVGNSSGNRIVGNAGNNSLEGGFGNDTLDGGIGGDTLIGGEGADVFLFNSKIGGSNIDRISDFDVSCDVILLNSTIFSGFDGGIITGDQLAFNNLGRAVDGSDRIIYETDTGALLYDSDGAGVKIAVKFAQLAPWLDLSIDNFALL